MTRLVKIYPQVNNQGPSGLLVSNYRPEKIPSPLWRECIKKVWEVDPLACPKCGCEMKIISFITEVASSYNLFHNFAPTHDGVEAGTGSFAADPLFSDAELHLSLGSPAIDAGDPASPFANEPQPNGERVNLGAFGNTATATRSASPVIPTILPLLLSE